MGDRQKNEGEGNRTAARRYNKDSKEFVDSGKVEKSAQKARRAVEGDEAKALKRAENEGPTTARNYTLPPTGERTVRVYRQARASGIHRPLRDRKTVGIGKQW